MVRFHIGTEVSHIDNIKLKMRVRKIIYQKKKLKHIVCSWFDEDGYKTDEFHSHELVPFNIAKLGQENVDSYVQSIADRKKFKTYEDELN